MTNARFRQWSPGRTPCAHPASPSRQRSEQKRWGRNGVGLLSTNSYLLADPPHRNKRGFPRSSRPPIRNTLRNSGTMLRMARARKRGFSSLWRCCCWWRDRRKIPRKGVLEQSRRIALGRGAATQLDALGGYPEWLEELRESPRINRDAVLGPGATFTQPLPNRRSRP